MEEALDIFRNDAFSVSSLQIVVPNVTYVPSRLSQLPLFGQPRRIRTRTVEIFQDQVTLRLIPTTEIGADDVEQLRDQGKINYLRTLRVAKKDRVIASELQDIADWTRPSNLRLRDAADLVVKRLGKLRREHEMTREFQLLGMIQGKIIDADGVTVLRDFYSEFGVSAPTLIDVDFANMAEADLMIYFQDTFFRPIMRALKDRKNGNVGIAALVGDTFWNRLMRHPGFYELYKIMLQGRAIANAANPLMVPNAWNEVYFAGVTWINYMGTDDGSTIAVPADEARFFPLGAEDVFAEYLSPGERLQDANTEGQDWYPIVQPDPRTQMNEYVDIRLRRYPLPACIYPGALMRGRVKP